MSLHDFIKLLQSRWATVLAITVAGVVVAFGVSLLTTPVYQASTRLFVATNAGASATELYQSNLLAQQRVKSYTELLTGETLAQRTIDKLGLDTTAQQLTETVQASAKLDTVLIKVSVQDTSAVRARDIVNALSDEFVVMVRELETSERGAKPDARVFVEQRASIPETPISPNTPRNIGIGLVLGLALGVGLAALRDTLDNTVKDRKTVEELTNYGLVGNIPLDKDRRTEPVMSFDRDNSAIAEAFRKLRTNLRFLAVDNPPRVIVVTSSMPNDGKTTTAINLALALAEADHNVALVDGDMRRPMLDKHFDLIGQVGFSTVLSGAMPLDEVLQKTRFPNLTVLTSGTVPPNPSELLGSIAAQKVMVELRTSFDYVIVDSSPLLAVTDAAILSTICDGTLVVARYGRTKRDQLTHAISNLADVGATVLGVVLTMTPTRRGSAYRNKYAYYGHSVSSQPTATDEPVVESSEAEPLQDISAVEPKEAMRNQ